ncbi:hypothetical protein [Flavobacterium sp.]|uniref:hypothetical protein n=1 Tax=Flavobacterium sp. TaxID=239 RepID=UPI003918A4D3
MDIQFSGNPKPFGIIGLVLAIISLLFSLIPCIGFYAFIPALIASIFSLIAFLHAKQNKTNHNVSLAGMIIGILAMGIAIFQYITYKEVFKVKSEIEETIKKVDSAMVEKVMDTLAKSYEQKAHNDSINEISKDSIK